VAGPAISKIITSLYAKDKLTPDQVSRMADVTVGRVAGDLTDDMIRAGCKHSKFRPSLLEWLIPSAHAAAGDCIVSGKSGRVYTIPHGKAEDCITAANKAEDDPQIREKLIELAQNITCAQYISDNCKASILREFPGEYLDKTVDQVLKDAKNGIRPARSAKKLLFDNRFQK
jgi:hypothetical protein